MRIHGTNLTGMGSRRLFESLLPQLLEISGESTTVYLHADDPIIGLVSDMGANLVTIRRFLPNAISRLIEVTLGSKRYRGSDAILVLGDIPLRGIERQTVLVQNSFLINAEAAGGMFTRLKKYLLQVVFAINAPRVDTFIVQTQSMKEGLVRRYAIPEDRVRIIGQPPPEVVRRMQGKMECSPESIGNRRLKLFYPARMYPHKNHALLDRAMLDLLAEDVSEIVLTIPQEAIGERSHPILRCIGEIDIDRVVEEYKAADALLFLSRAESYGLPLLEALWLDLPVVCPDLPYARDIIGDNDYYFDLDSAEELPASVRRLREDLANNRITDWSDRRSFFPVSWQEVAEVFASTVE